MSTFSKAKLKRFNDVDVIACASPSRHAAVCLDSAHASSSSNNHHGERKEQIEKFFKDAVRFTSSSKDANSKEDKKTKGLRLFRTPSLPHRLRFRQNSDITTPTASATTTATPTATGSSTPLPSQTTSAKEISKSAKILKGKEALQQEIRNKNELIENYLKQIDVLKRHVEQLKESEAKLREEHACIKQRRDTMIHELISEKNANQEMNEQLTEENARLAANVLQLESDVNALQEQHSQEIQQLRKLSEDLESRNERLEMESKQYCEQIDKLQESINAVVRELKEAQKRVEDNADKLQENFYLIGNLKHINDSLNKTVSQLKQQMERDALTYAQETKLIQNEMDSVKNERNALKNDLATKCDLIESLKNELLDKNCEIDAHCDTIRQLCRENAQYVERERLLKEIEEKLSAVEANAEKKIHKMECDLENSLEKERNFWRTELEKRQKMAENEIIKIELEKQDVMVLLETTNDMLRERDEKIQKYEEQLRNGIDYYIQLTNNLQKQAVDLKQDMAKTITEKYNYQLTLNNTRSTVNILMERLKKSDTDVELLKKEVEMLKNAKVSVEEKYEHSQAELERMRQLLKESEAALISLRNASETLQKEVSVKECMFNEILNSEEDCLAKFNKIASSFQESIDYDAAKYLDMYNKLKNKDETREMYMQDMKKALDEFATVLQYAQLELDNKDKDLGKMREECEQLKLENIALKSKLEDTITVNVSNNMVTTPNKSTKENCTDLEKIEGLLIDSDLRSECDKIATWLLTSSHEKNVRHESSTEINELLKSVTPNKKRDTPSRSLSSSKIIKTNTSATVTTPITTPRTPRTPKSTGHTPRTTATKKTVLFPGKENIPNSPQKQILKARNV